MGSLTSLMNMAQQSLSADQNALNVTSNNVANQNTPGYTREVVVWQPSDAVTLSGVTYNEGIKTTAALPAGSQILEPNVWHGNRRRPRRSSGARFTKLRCNRLRNIFSFEFDAAASASSTALGLGTAAAAFFGALSALTGNPSDTATRQNVLAAANTLASAFNFRGELQLSPGVLEPLMSNGSAVWSDR